MLFKQTISTELLGLLNHLMQVPCFKQYNLVGGTSLALQIGHRNSVDIDLFGLSEINQIDFLEILNGIGDVKLIKQSINIFITTVNGIKVDFVNYKYLLLDHIIEVEGIRLVSKKDIAAMKLNAIAGRGSKKDFIDLYFLFDFFSLEEMVSFYKQKYNDGSEFMVLKSLTYFDDADDQVEPLMKVPFNWEQCKADIRNEVKKIL